MNKIQIIGNLVRDAQTSNVGENSVTKFTVASDNLRADDAPDFFEVESWGKSGASRQPYLSKGSSVYVDGHIKIESYDYESKREPGVRIKGTKFIVVAGDIKFLSVKNENKQTMEQVQE